MVSALIGVTTTHTTSITGLAQLSVQEAYTQALVQAGAIPVLLPLGVPAEGIELMLERLDGILFTGGGDIHPQVYGGKPHPQVEGVDNDRDRIEGILLRLAMRRRLPFLGICRGLQVVNVNLGGSIYEDILDQRPNALRHQYGGDEPRNYLAHSVQVEGDSRLGQIVKKSELQVNSLHHQGILKLAAPLRASAFAPDGLIEAVELPDYPFGLAVQWHPEWLTNQAEMQRLFSAFTLAAQDQNQHPA